MIQAYTGDGKGKTTCAVGLAVRAFGAGKKVFLLFFDKGSKNYLHHELVTFDKLEIDYVITGLDRMNPDGSFRFGVLEEDKLEAERGLKLVNEVLISHKYDLIILDEILSAVTYGLISKDSLHNILEIAKQNQELELVITGRCNDHSLLENCDLVTEMKKVKHYYDKGINARPGIEY